MLGCAFVCHLEKKTGPPYISASAFTWPVSWKPNAGGKHETKHRCLANFQYCGWFVENPKVIQSAQFNAVSWYFMVDGYHIPKFLGKAIKQLFSMTRTQKGDLDMCIPFFPFVPVTGGKMWWWLCQSQMATNYVGLTKSKRLNCWPKRSGDSHVYIPGHITMRPDLVMTSRQSWLWIFVFCFNLLP